MAIRRPASLTAIAVGCLLLAIPSALMAAGMARHGSIMSFAGQVFQTAALVVIGFGMLRMRLFFGRILAVPYAALGIVSAAVAAFDGRAKAPIGAAMVVVVMAWHAILLWWATRGSRGDWHPTPPIIGEGGHAGAAALASMAARRSARVPVLLACACLAGCIVGVFAAGVIATACVSVGGAASGPARISALDTLSLAATRPLSSTMGEDALPLEARTAHLWIKHAAEAPEVLLAAVACAIIASFLASTAVSGCIADDRPSGAFAHLIGVRRRADEWRGRTMAAASHASAAAMAAWTCALSVVAASNPDAMDATAIVAGTAAVAVATLIGVGIGSFASAVAGSAVAAVFMAQGIVVVPVLAAAVAAWNWCPAWVACCAPATIPLAILHRSPAVAVAAVVVGAVVAVAAWSSGRLVFMGKDLR